MFSRCPTARGLPAAGEMPLPFGGDNSGWKKLILARTGTVGGTMDRLQAMNVFVAVADVGGFAGAARRLAMSPPAVTRAIAALETAIGARLLTRTTRHVRLTDAGGRYLDDCRRILAAVGEAEASAAGSHTRPTGVLTVTAPILFGRLHVLSALTGFLAAHPSVEGRALFLDRFVHLVDEGVDVAVRIGDLADSGLVAIRCGIVRRVVVGAPAYLADQGRPEFPADLARHRIIGLSHSASPNWQFASKEAVSVRPRLSCNVNEAAIAAAVDGWGLTQVLSYQVAGAVVDGRLEIVLDRFETEPLPVHVVHVEGGGASAKTRAFVDHVVRHLRTNAVLNPPVAPGR